MGKNFNITTCGLNCDLCDANKTKIQDSAKYLLDIFKDPMFSSVISMANPDFRAEDVPIFKKMLKNIGEFPPCPGCKGRHGCSITECAKEKGLENCSKCDFLDLKESKCNAIPNLSKESMMPPAPIFFNIITQRYQKWNLNNLKAISEGKKESVNSIIEKMLKEGKTNRDLIDFSINLFDMKP